MSCVRFRYAADFADGFMALWIWQEPVKGALKFDGEVEARSCCRNQTDLKLKILLPCPQDCWLGL